MGWQPRPDAPSLRGEGGRGEPGRGAGSCRAMTRQEAAGRPRSPSSGPCARPGPALAWHGEGRCSPSPVLHCSQAGSGRTWRVMCEDAAADVGVGVPGAHGPCPGAPERCACPAEPGARGQGGHAGCAAGHVGEWRLLTVPAPARRGLTWVRSQGKQESPKQAEAATRGRVREGTLPRP